MLLRRGVQGPKILVTYHYALTVPSTGRDMNLLRDAGDVRAVDMGLAGNRRVPYV